MKRKLYFIINSFASGGAERVLSVIVNELAKIYQIEIFLLEKPLFYELDKRVKITYLSNCHGNESGIKKFLFIPVFAYKLKRYVKKKRINLIQSHNYRANYVNVFSKVLGAGHKAQIVNHGIIGRYFDEGFNGKINLLLVRILYQRADLIIWVSKMMKINANKLFKFKNKQVVINNPFDINNIKLLANEKINNFEFSNDKIFLVSVGSLIALKRNKDLIKALEFLDDSIEIVFIGDGEEKDYLIELAKNLKLMRRVRFLGNVNNPFKYLKHCDIFVHTSETEGFPNVLVEAMACELPVISSDCISGPREILAPNTDFEFQLKNNIEKAEYGILYPVGDVKCLVKAINLMLQNDNILRNYKKNGINRVKYFSLERIIEQYKALFFIN